MDLNDPLEAARALGASLAVGLLIGVQRGWQQRNEAEGSRVAGLRTFTLLGLLGGLLAAGWPESPWPVVAGIAAVVLLLAVSWGHAAQATGSISITSAVAALVTLVLGAVAAQGNLVTAIGLAVVVALLLDLKPELHRGLRLIHEAEISAALQLGVLSAVILPLLPREGFGPYGAINPFELWLAVIFIAALSLVGHGAMRWRGARQGLLWTGLLGGLASSTAATLALSRAVRDQQELLAPAAAGIVAANAVMFVRMAVVVSLLQPSLALRLGGLLALLGAGGAAAAWFLWRRQRGGATGRVEGDGKLFDLPTALGFAFALGLVGVLVPLAREHLGVAGVYGVAFLSGLVDVDAIVISSVQLQARGELPALTTTVAILLAVLANMTVKAGTATAVGGRALGLRVALGYLASVAPGVAVAVAVGLA